MQWSRHALVLSILFLCLAAVGCGSLKISPMPNREISGLDAQDIVMVMRRAGFGDSQILKHGTELRNTLALQGAASVHKGRNTEALFTVVDGYVHVSSRIRGSFIYDVKAKKCL